MKIHALTEKNKPFVYLSTGRAFCGLENYLDCQVNLFDYRDWYNHCLVTPHEDVDIFIFESVYMELCNLHTRLLRAFYPNAKLVALGSDTIYYIKTGKNGGWQFNSPLDVDLFLETMSEVREEYKNRGVKVDKWMWTISESLISHLEGLPRKNWKERLFDFISLLSPHTIGRQGSYRQEMVEYLKNRYCNFTRGLGSGMDDKNPDITHLEYGNAKITIGTSSHDNPQFFGVKGYRDAIGPFMDSLLVYDDFKDVVDNYQVGTLVPAYGYGKFHELVEILDYFDANETHRNLCIEAQKKFFRENTIEKQLVRLFKKYGIC